MTVVSNTSPLCYLLLIDQINLLPQLFGQITIPQAVCDELGASESLAILQSWIAQAPEWLEIQSITTKPDEVLEELDLGEREAIALAQQLEAELILLDDRAARRVAAERGLLVTGVLGILDRAATRGLIDFPTAIDRLRQTTFWTSDSLIESLLERHRPARP